MNVFYYIKEIIYYFIYYIVFLITTMYIFINKNIMYILYQNKNIHITEIIYIFLKIPYNIPLRKLEWKQHIENKNIIHVEYYTLETIYYKLIMYYIIIITLFFMTFVIMKWFFNITYKHEKKMYILSVIIYTFFITLDLLYLDVSVQNITNKLISSEQNKYYNYYLEPQYTMESLVDTKFFFLILILVKYIFIVIIQLCVKNYFNYYKYVLFITFFMLVHIDFLYAIYNIIEIELILILLKIILYMYGDDRN